MNGYVGYTGETQAMPAGATARTPLPPHQLAILPTFVETRRTPTYHSIWLLEVAISVTGGAAAVAGADLYRMLARIQVFDGRDKIVDIMGQNLLRLNRAERGGQRPRDAAAVGIGAPAGTLRRFYLPIYFSLEADAGGGAAEKREDGEYLVASTSRGQMLIDVDPSAFTSLAGAGSAVASIQVTPHYLLTVRPGAPVAWIYTELGEFTRANPDWFMPGGSYYSATITNQNAAAVAGFPNHGNAVYPNLQIEGGKRIDRDTDIRRQLAAYDVNRFSTDARAGGAFSLLEQDDAAALDFLPLLFPVGSRARISRDWWANEAGHRVRVNGATPANSMVSFRRRLANMVKAEAHRDAMARASIPPEAWDRGISKTESKKRTTAGLREFISRKVA